MKKTFLLVATLSVITSFAQKISGNLHFTKGQSVAVSTNTTISAETMMGASSGTITTSDVYMVNEAAANTFSLTKVPKQVKMNFTMGSQQIKVDSDNPKEMNSMFAQPVKDIMSQRPEFTIDGTGKIIAVKKDEKKKEEAPAAGMMGMMLPGMDMSSSLPQVGNASLFQVLPAREVGVGDTWTDSLQDAGNTNVTTYVVKTINDAEIVLDFRSEGRTVSSQEAMGMKVNVNAANRGTGTIVLDRATGIVKQKTSVNTTETTMNLGGREVNSTVKSISVTNVSPS